MPRPTLTIDSPVWFSISNYSAAESIDAADWYVNLALRAEFARGELKAALAAVRGPDAIIRRADGLPLPLALVEHDFDPDLARILSGELPSLGIAHLTGQELYLFERKLPPDVRRFGASFVPGVTKAKNAPTGFSGPIDHLFEQRYLSQFVRLDLSRPDEVLVEDLKLFIRRERRALAEIAGEYPSAAALRTLGKCNRANLMTFARIGLLPFLDLEQWRRETQTIIPQAAYARLLDVGPEDVRETRKKAELVLNDFVLRGWLLPRARAAMVGEWNRAIMRKI